MLRVLAMAIGVPLLTMLMAGCGFQLKGTATAGASTLTGTDIAVVASDPRGELATALKQSLKFAGANLVPRSDDVVVVQIASEQFNRRNLSLTAQARAAEVELTLGTRFVLRQGDRLLVADTDATVIRQMLDDPSNVVGKNEELRLLRTEMRRDVVDLIVRRINRSLDN